jgi:hypothetical protein
MRLLVVFFDFNQRRKRQFHFRRLRPMLPAWAAAADASPPPIEDMPGSRLARGSAALFQN